jgi:hypothetical protein
VAGVASVILPKAVEEIGAYLDVAERGLPHGHLVIDQFGILGQRFFKEGVNRKRAIGYAQGERLHVKTAIFGDENVDPVCITPLLTTGAALSFAFGVWRSKLGDYRPPQLSTGSLFNPDFTEIGVARFLATQVHPYDT